MTQKYSIDAQLEEVRMAMSDYPGLARGGAISKSKIDFRIERLKSVCRTLDWVKTNETELRAWIAAQKDKRIVDEIECPPLDRQRGPEVIDELRKKVGAK